MVNIWSFIDHLIGTRCALCGVHAHGLCADCVAALPANHHNCARCAVPLPVQADPGRWCAGCQRREPDFDLVVAPLRYQAPVDTLIADIKFRGRLALVAPMAGPLLAAIEQTRTVSRPLPEALVPVPMHASRLRQRGFNHAAELSRALAGSLRLPVANDLVRRTRPTRPQLGLSQRARRSNVREAFHGNGSSPRHVAVVDDVMTTGATVDRISRVLRTIGAEEIEIWSVARTPAP